MKKYLLWLIIVTFLFICDNVLAVDYSDTTCNYNSKAYLNKLAYEVDASYSLKQDDNGNYSFDISIYNIVEDIYITYNVEDEIATTTVLPSETTNGVYTFNVADTTSIITYEITVRTLNFGCIDDIRKFTITKPKRNNYYDLDICKYDEVVDYLYCREWITQDFGLTDAEIKEKIINKRSAKKVVITTTAASSESEEDTNKNKIETIKRYLIIGLSIGIASDIVIIYIKISNIRRYEI